MRYAICNETFDGWDHARVCRYVAGLGYTGLELAPFTLAPRITDVSAERRRELKRQADECGVTLIGLHWLLAKTEGLHLTSPDPGTHPPPRRPHRTLSRQRPQPPRPRLRRGRFRADLPRAEGDELPGLGVGGGVRLHAGPRDDRA